MRRAMLTRAAPLSVLETPSWTPVKSPALSAEMPPAATMALRSSSSRWFSPGLHHGSPGALPT